MLMSLWRNVCLVALLSMSLTAIPGVAAQPNSPMTLNLKGDKQAKDKTRVRSLGEFSVSLDSQMFEAAEAGQLNVSSEKTPDTFVLQSRFLSAAEGLPGQESSKLLPDLSHTEKRDLGSTLTLTATYLEDQFGRTASTPNAMGAQKRLGRWAVYGEIGRPPSLDGFISKDPSAALIRPSVMMNMNAANQAKGPAQTTISKTPSVEENEVPTLADYYLEAIYNFHPLLKGKVSYKRSQLDPLDRNENLQVEGIVDTGRDTMIKAGYRNKTSPEVKDHKLNSDTKVWTEFILKF